MMDNHLIIAGTGRSGTSFLVQFLAACGLETRLTAYPDAKLDENANAGLEDIPIAGYALPYVVKSPWLFELVDELVERTDITLDAVIMPMRDIVEAATSRVILEMRARYGNEHLDPEIARWENWGETPGGVVYSLNPIDQARILALGFHRTVQALVRKDVPIIFLDFPRLIDDADYLWARLEPILRHRITQQGASVAHSKLADRGKVRIAKEINASTERTAVENQAPKISENPVMYPDHDTLDRAALIRELTRLRGETKRSLADATRSADVAARLKVEDDQRRKDMDDLHARSEQAERARGEGEALARALKDKLQQAERARDEGEAAARALKEKLQEAERARDEGEAVARALKDKLQQVETQLSDRLKNEYEAKLSNHQRESCAHINTLEQTITALRASNSWRITQPLRAMSQWIRGRP